MDKINFITTATPKQQHSLQNWFYASVLLLGLMVTVLVGISSWQLYCWKIAQNKTRITKKQALPFIEALEKKRKIQEELDNISLKSDRIKQSLRQTETIHSHLHAINKTFSNQTSIAALHLKNGLNELIVHVPDTKTAFLYLQKLKEELGNKNLYISTLEPANTLNNPASSNNELKTDIIISIKQSKKVDTKLDKP